MTTADGVLQHGDPECPFYFPLWKKIRIVATIAVQVGMPKLIRDRSLSDTTADRLGRRHRSLVESSQRRYGKGVWDFASGHAGTAGHVLGWAAPAWISSTQADDLVKCSQSAFLSVQ